MHYIALAAASSNKNSFELEKHKPNRSAETELRQTLERHWQQWKECLSKSVFFGESSRYKEGKLANKR